MEVVKWRGDDGVRSAIIVNEGRKFISLIPIESGKVRIRKILLSEGRHLTPIKYKGKPYPLSRAIRIFKRHAKSFGITDSAKRALR